MRRMMVGMLMAAIAAAGCGKRAEQAAAEPASVPEAFVSEKPAGEPIPIPEARALESGTDVVLQGRVMGVRAPFVDGRAVFVLGDTGTINPCTDDHCSIPWDACCDPPDVRAAGTVTIQVLDEGGEVLAQSVKGLHGLKELSRVTVAGTVAQNSSAESFVVNATSLYVDPGNTRK